MIGRVIIRSDDGSAAGGGRGVAAAVGGSVAGEVEEVGEIGGGGLEIEEGEGETRFVGKCILGGNEMRVDRWRIVLKTGGERGRGSRLAV